MESLTTRAHEYPGRTPAYIEAARAQEAMDDRQRGRQCRIVAGRARADQQRREMVRAARRRLNKAAPVLLAAMPLDHPGWARLLTDVVGGA